MKPIIKWVGGKQGNLQHIRDRLPESFNTYYEPFLGGGAVLFDLNPTNAVVNDINPELINMYQQVQTFEDRLVWELDHLDTHHEFYADDPKAFYYIVREEFNRNLGTNTPEQAARFIYLNKHCFNGLYRVNKKGQFNVPFNGRLLGHSYDIHHLREASARLKDVDIRCGDYLEVLEEAKSGDLAFLDSPYAPLNPTSFTDYTKEGFEYEDHVNLAAMFKRLSDRGVNCILTNHDTPLIRELYKDFRIEVVDVRRSINRNGSDRTGKEVIITNYNPEGTDFTPIVIEPHDEGDVE